MLLRVQHETKLTYTSPVSETVFEVRMAPPSDDDQTSLATACGSPRRRR